MPMHGSIPSRARAQPPAGPLLGPARPPAIRARGASLWSAWPAATDAVVICTAAAAGADRAQDTRTNLAHHASTRRIGDDLPRTCTHSWSRNDRSSTARGRMLLHQRRWGDVSCGCGTVRADSASEIEEKKTRLNLTRMYTRWTSRELRRPIALIDGRPGPLNYPFCALPSRVLAETPMEPWYLSFD